MRVRTLLLYLIGHRQAILDIASDRRSLFLGFLFVLSAGFAREYDGADLVHEPWHLAIPFGASLATSFLLFCLTYGSAEGKTMQAPPFFSSYRVFLGLFWMTAPLAWLYAIPYERFLGPVEATSANLWTLGLVAFWRVVLMIRVLSVLMGYRHVAAIFFVMALADVEALLGLCLSPIPLIEVMGGIHGSASETLRKSMAKDLCFLGTCSLPFWVIGAFIAGVKSCPRWQGPPTAVSQSHTWSWPLGGLVFTSIAIWFLFLPFTQPEQQLRNRVERGLKEGRIAEALAEMSAHYPSGFPPHWDPPPKLALGQREPPLVDVMEVIADSPPTPWVRSIFIEKFERYLARYPIGEREAKLLLRLPEGKALVKALIAARGELRYVNELLEEVVEKLGLDDQMPATSKRARDKLAEKTRIENEKQKTDDQNE
jgi:hypothetical protein